MLKVEAGKDVSLTDTALGKGIMPQENKGIQAGYHRKWCLIAGSLKYL